MAIYIDVNKITDRRRRRFVIAENSCLVAHAAIAKVFYFDTDDDKVGETDGGIVATLGFYHQANSRAIGNVEDAAVNQMLVNGGIEKE